MERYDYNEAVKNDVLDYIRDNYTEDEIKEKLIDYDRNDFEEELREDLWTVDSVTGNGSGSYYCNAWMAEKAIAHNLDLLGEAFILV